MLLWCCPSAAVGTRRSPGRPTSCIPDEIRRCGGGERDCLGELLSISITSQRREAGIEAKE